MRRRGQFLILTVIFICIIILTLTIVAQMASIQYQVIPRERYVNIVTGIEKDLKRLLKAMLSKTSSFYFKNHGFISNKKTDNIKLLSLWTETVIKTYYSYGIQFNIKIDKSPGLLITKPYNVTFRNLDGIEKNYTFKVISTISVDDICELYWYAPQSVSIAYSRIEGLNLTNIGFYGWSKDVMVALNMSINKISLEKTSILSPVYVNVEFTLLDENLNPVLINISNIKIKYFDPTKNISNEENPWIDAEIISLEYLGLGKYRAKYEYDVNGLPSEIANYANKYAFFILMTINDSRGIYIEACSYNSFKIAFQDNFNGSLNAEQVYVIEYGIDGTIACFNRKISYDSKVPIPPIPINIINVTDVNEGNITYFDIELWRYPFKVWRVNVMGVEVGERPDFSDAMPNVFNYKCKLIFYLNLSSINYGDTKEIVINWSIIIRDFSRYEYIKEKNYFGGLYYDNKIFNVSRTDYAATKYIFMIKNYASDTEHAYFMHNIKSYSIDEYASKCYNLRAFFWRKLDRLNEENYILAYVAYNLRYIRIIGVYRLTLATGYTLTLGCRLYPPYQYFYVREDDSDPGSLQNYPLRYCDNGFKWLFSDIKRLFSAYWGIYLVKVDEKYLPSRYCFYLDGIYGFMGIDASLLSYNFYYNFVLWYDDEVFSYPEVRVLGDSIFNFFSEDSALSIQVVNIGT